MNALQIIGLIVFIVALAGVLGFLFQSRKDTQDELPTVETFTPEELENIKLAEELYNKDLRPVVAKKAKPAPELEVVEPEFVAKEEKVFSDDAVINTEAIKEIKEAKSEFPIDKPKKKRKYYPKKTK